VRRLVRDKRRSGGHRVEGGQAQMRRGSSMGRLPWPPRREVTRMEGEAASATDAIRRVGERGVEDGGVAAQDIAVEHAASDAPLISVIVEARAIVTTHVARCQQRCQHYRTALAPPRPPAIPLTAEGRGGARERAPPSQPSARTLTRTEKKNGCREGGAAATSGERGWWPSAGSGAGGATARERKRRPQPG
jgi:hypothetical protein